MDSGCPFAVNSPLYFQLPSSHSSCLQIKHGRRDVDIFSLKDGDSKMVHILFRCFLLAFRRTSVHMRSSSIVT